MSQIKVGDAIPSMKLMKATADGPKATLTRSRAWRAPGARL